MTKTMFLQKCKIPALLIMIGLLMGNTQAQSGNLLTDSSATHSISLEADPAPFLLNGYSFSIRYSHQKLPHWSVMASAFAADFPNGMLSDINKQNGWSQLRFGCSKALFVDYHFRKNGKGFFAGPSLFTYNSSITNTLSGKTSAFKSVYPNLRIGYTWFPFKKLNLYAVPWLNMGKEFMVNTTDAAAGVAYQPDKFKYILALHIGYRYSFDKLFQHKKQIAGK